MSFDVDRARRETPGCSRVLHLNNAGAALMPSAVAEAVRRHLDRELHGGGYEAARVAWDDLEGVYDSLARLLGCRRHEIAVVENATRAWDMAFYSLALGEGDVVLTAEAEYASNYIAYLHRARRTGAKIVVVPSDESGAISLSALEARLDGNVRLIALSHVPTNGGLVNPVAAVGRLARAAGVPFLLDACQSAGQMPLDVDAIGCDMLTATSRKYLRGPRGVGFLYVRQEMIPALDPPFLDLHAAEWTGPDDYSVRTDARRFETWECNWAGKIGLGVAVDYALDWGLDAIHDRIRYLGDGLRQRLDAVPGVAVHDLGQEKCGLVSFTVDGSTPQAVQSELGGRAINIAVSPANFTLLDMRRRRFDALARASVHYYNTDAELDRFAETIETIARAGAKPRAGRT